MKYVVAVSGGVDSVVLLDMLVRIGKHELIVAHFDHGIRPESAADARFVEGLAKRYGLAFESKREELGESASEETARLRRYTFLQEVAHRHRATIVTAHHSDDVIETVAINLIRGSGWRGLAVLGNSAIARPLLKFKKSQLYTYAIGHQLEWVEDETNASSKYLRNRLRQKLLSQLTERQRDDLVILWNKQRKVRDAIDDETSRLLLVPSVQSRHFFAQIDEKSALELLRAKLARDKLSLTRPQRMRLLLGIKTMAGGKKIELGAGITALFTQRDFTVKNLR